MWLLDKDSLFWFAIDDGWLRSQNINIYITQTMISAILSKVYSGAQFIVQLHIGISICLHFSTGGAAHCTRSHQGASQHSWCDQGWLHWTGGIKADTEFLTDQIGKQRHAVSIFFVSPFLTCTSEPCIKLTKPPWSCHRCWIPRRPRQEQRLAILGELRIRKRDGDHHIFYWFNGEPKNIREQNCPSGAVDH